MAALNPERFYAKTEKGREEIARRSHGLTQAMRAVLIPFDGKAPRRSARRSSPSRAMPPQTG